MPRRFALCACAALCCAPLPGSAASKEPDTGAQARSLLRSAESRAVLGDTDGAIARALLAHALDPGVGIPQSVVRAALSPTPPMDAPGAPDARSDALAMQLTLLQRETQALGQRLDRVDLDLRDRANPEPLVQRLERTMTELQRQIDRLQSEVRRLEMEVQRLRSR